MTSITKHFEKYFSKDSFFTHTVGVTSYLTYILIISLWLGLKFWIQAHA